MDERQDKIVTAFLAAIGGALGLGALLWSVPNLPPYLEPFAGNMGVAAMALGAGILGLVGLSFPDLKKRRRYAIERQEHEAQQLISKCKDAIDRVNMLRGFGCPSDLAQATDPKELNLSVLSYNPEEIWLERNVSPDAVLDIRERTAANITIEARRILEGLDRRLSILREVRKDDFPAIRAVAGEEPAESNAGLRAIDMARG